MTVVLVLVVEYILGALAMMAMMIKGRPWDIHGWSRRKKFWNALWGTTLNMLLWPIPVVQTLWNEL